MQNLLRRVDHRVGVLDGAHDGGAGDFAEDGFIAVIGFPGVSGQLGHSFFGAKGVVVVNHSNGGLDLLFLGWLFGALCLGSFFVGGGWNLVVNSDGSLVGCWGAVAVRVD